MNEAQDLLKQIESQLATVPDFGQLQIHIKKHTGKFLNTDYVKMTSYKYSDIEPNVTCTADIVRLIKSVAEAKLDGSLNFSVDFKHGSANVMRVQNFNKL